MYIVPECDKKWMTKALHVTERIQHMSVTEHCAKLRPYSTGAVWRAASSGLEGFGNFGRLHYRIKEGGHFPYEG